MGLNKKSWLLIIINAIHAIISLFYSTFLVAYFFNITDNNIVPTSLFYIFIYALVIIGFPLIGSLVKNGYKLYLYRISFLVNFAGLLLLIYFKEDIVNHLWLLGFVLGAAKTLYWFPQNVFVSEIANKNQIVKYPGYSNFFIGVVKIVMPVILGYFITMNSFINTAGLILVLTLILFGLSFLLEDHKIKHKKFSLRALLALAIKREKIRTVLKVEFLRGVVLDITDVLIVLYIMYMFKTNLNLGILTSVFAVCTIVVDFILGRCGNFKAFGFVLRIANILIFTTTAFFVFDTSKLTFVFYNFAVATAGEVIKTVCGANMYKMSQDKSVVSHYRAEYIALREMYLNSGRIIGFSTAILVSLIGNNEILKYLILLFSCVWVYVGYLSKFLSQKFVKN